MTEVLELLTREDLRKAVQSDMNINDNSSLYPPSAINLALQRSYVKSYRLFRWPGTEDAKKTTTQQDQDYYDAPDTFVPDSIWRVEVDGVMYGEGEDGSPLSFKDYLVWKSNNPNSTEKKWAKQWTRYFISPTPSAAGIEICVYGQVNPDRLDDDSDETIFSNNLPECNEAIVLEAKAILKHKGQAPKEGEFYSAEAKGILSVAFSRIKQDGSLEKKNLPMFNVPDFFARNNQTQVTGNFVTQI